MTTLVAWCIRYSRKACKCGSMQCAWGYRGTYPAHSTGLFFEIRSTDPVVYIIVAYPQKVPTPRNTHPCIGPDLLGFVSTDVVARVWFLVRVMSSVEQAMKLASWKHVHAT